MFFVFVVVWPFRAIGKPGRLSINHRAVNADLDSDPTALEKVAELQHCIALHSSFLSQ